MLKRVTFSGIDPWTKPQELRKLADEYPFVEFAFLLTENHAKAGNRYPHPMILKSYRQMNLPMAVHFCGKLAYDLVKTNDWGAAQALLGPSMKLFDRIQFNIPKTKHFRRDLAFPAEKAIIIQLHEGTEELYECYRHLPNVQGFQDDSGGQGIACKAWRAPQGEFFGYAGGLGPENVVEAVQAIQTVCDRDFWIDMETSIRTGDRFDVEKCRQVCEALVKSGWVKKGEML